jgi:hypothetical protein
LSRPEGAVTGDSQGLIGSFGIAKGRRPWKTGLRYKSALARHLSSVTVLWDSEKLCKTGRGAGCSPLPTAGGERLSFSFLDLVLPIRCLPLSDELTYTFLGHVRKGWPCLLRGHQDEYRIGYYSSFKRVLLLASGLPTAMQNLGPSSSQAVRNSAGAGLQVCEVIENAHLKVGASPVRLDFSQLLHGLGSRYLTKNTTPREHGRHCEWRGALKIQSNSWAVISCHRLLISRVVT